MKTIVLAFRFALAAFLPASLLAVLPDTLPYQGRIAVKDLNFTGTGSFKFSIYEHATGAFTPASASAVVTNGFVTSVTVLDGGKGYSSGVTVAFNGVGNGATATATVVDGVVTGIAIVTPGSGYSTAPTVVLNEPTAPTQLWNNTFGPTDAALEEPRFAVPLEVRNGLYTVGLGDTALTVMQPLPASLAPAAGKRVFLRVWFDDGAHGFQALAPDTELHAVPFAREAANTASVGGVSLANLARLDTSNTFTSVNGLTVTGTGPSGTTPAAGATVPLSGPGTRMEFLPGYGAFRAGTVTGTQWDAAQIGVASTALGYNSTASGYAATALGNTSTAQGQSSTASGEGTVAAEWASTAFGFYTRANGQFSTAFGLSSVAENGASTAFGVATRTTGYGATAFGNSTIAGGAYSLAAGLETNAESAYETVFGRCDTAYTPLSTTGWNPADRLFVIGNGLSDTSRSDALVMLKSGATTLNGTLRVNALDGLAVVGAGPDGSTPATGSTVPVTGAGTRLMFLPGFGAFRAGTVTGTQWDAANIGNRSTALGYNTIASGSNSTALGFITTASGTSSVALGSATSASANAAFAAGNSTTASGSASTALGVNTQASGNYATALGQGTTASGGSSMAVGMNTVASGEYSTALGGLTRAEGHGSTACGYSTTASGQYSTALGHLASATNTSTTALGQGVEANGVASTAIGINTRASSFAEVAVGRLNTIAAGASATDWVFTDRLFVVGNGYVAGLQPVYSDALIVYKNGNATLQGTLTQGSDRNRKTDIVPADTAAVLAGVTALPLATWKYRDETATHLGPMAQDFRAAFHLGDTDTGIASVDADGVALAAIQELKKQLDAKDAKIAALEARLAALEAKLP